MNFVVEFIAGREENADFMYPFLTIAIPNFNQADNLLSRQGFIESLGPFLISGEIEVLVADNNSVDNSVVALMGWPRQVKVFQNTRNLGFSRNLERLIELSGGKWVWFLGSGDTLSTSFSALLEEIKALDANVVWISPSSNQYRAICPFLSENIFLHAALKKVLREKHSNFLADEESFAIWPHAYFSLTLIRLGYLGHRTARLSIIPAQSSEKGWAVRPGFFTVLGPLARLLRFHKSLPSFRSDMALLKKSVIRWFIQDRIQSRGKATFPQLTSLVKSLGTNANLEVFVLFMLYFLPRKSYSGVVILFRFLMRNSENIKRKNLGTSN